MAALPVLSCDQSESESESPRPPPRPPPRLSSVSSSRPPPRSSSVSSSSPPPPLLSSSSRLASSENSCVCGLRFLSLISPRVSDPVYRKMFNPSWITDSYIRPLYQYVDQAPPSWIGAAGGG